MKKLILIIIILSFNKYVFSHDLFISSFIDVEFVSNNIEDTKILKINQIKKESLKKILKKILNHEKYNQVSSDLSADLINSLIKNVIINDENIINNKYFSKIKVNFNKKKLINYFREKNIPYVEYYPKKFLLIIYEYNNINENLFTKINNFYLFYKKNKEKDGLFKIPNLDINDRFILKKEDIKNRNIDKINNFSNKYNFKETVIVIIKTSKNKIVYDLILHSGGQIAEKKIELKNNDYDKFFEKLEFESLNIWKTINEIQNSSLNNINCKINYFNMIELKEIRDNLNNVSIIKNLKKKSLSFRSIEYDISYYGNLKILTKIFKLNKLNISNYQNDCFIRLI